ncbi:MAG: hypothetical protein ACK5JD_00720 [Mangrovibacterium sp.]
MPTDFLSAFFCQSVFSLIEEMGSSGISGEHILQQIFFMAYQPDFTFCLATKSKQKSQGLFLAASFICRKAKFGG